MRLNRIPVDFPPYPFAGGQCRKAALHGSHENQCADESGDHDNCNPKTSHSNLCIHFLFSRPANVQGLYHITHAKGYTHTPCHMGATGDATRQSKETYLVKR